MEPKLLTEMNERLVRVETSHLSVVDGLRDVTREMKETNRQLAEALTQGKQIQDHESRLREVEKDRWKVHGVIALLGFIGFPTLCLLVYLVATKGVH